MLVDTHCHIHDLEFYPDTRGQIYHESRSAGVVMLCVGTDQKSSQEAVDFARTHDGVWAVVGVHPHEAKYGYGFLDELIANNTDVIVGVGEIGLDYFYNHSNRADQQAVLRGQLEIAMKYQLPVSFHVREAFDDFWPIFDEFTGVKGVLHSYTDTSDNAALAMGRGLYFGINGISTFTKDLAQQRLFADIPLDRIVLETDAPFLTPKPFRGKINSPAFVGRVAEHQAELKGVPLDVVMQSTTANATQLFNLK